jgi:hypothetical protein
LALTASTHGMSASWDTDTEFAGLQLKLVVDLNDKTR